LHLTTFSNICVIFIHFLIFVIVSKCRKSPKLMNIVILDRELRQLALTPGHATLTSSEPQEEALFQKHSREHVKVMIELGNKKRIKHPGDEAHESLETRKLSLEVISEHHPVHTKPTAELQIIKTLPISETLRRDATLGGYIFLCKDETMDLEIMNQRFGMYDLNVIRSSYEIVYSTLCSLFILFDLFFLGSMEICRCTYLIIFEF
jgi:hypothetical protein